MANSASNEAMTGRVALATFARLSIDNTTRSSISMGSAAPLAAEDSWLVE